MDEAWRKAQARALMQAGAKVRAATTLLFFALGIAILLTFDYTNVGFLLWLVTSVGVGVAITFLYYTKGWGKPRLFVCPGCKQSIPSSSELCPLCGYRGQ